MPRFYTGVGDHHVDRLPTRKLDEATDIARTLESWKFVLRSGRATGFDQAFERGVTNPLNKVIYLSSKEQTYSDDLWTMAVDLVVNTHPYPPSARYYMHLLARNAFQVLGDDLRTPSRFVVCWTKNGKDVGGTGTTIRIAQKFNIPVYNLHDMTKSDILADIREKYVTTGDDRQKW
jgi:hypothetical protein